MDEQRMVHIQDLPEDLLLDLLSLVPGRDLVHSCRLVCSQWRDLVDMATLWNRKCQMEGFLPRGQEKSVPDWRIFYFLCLLKRNVLKYRVVEGCVQDWKIDFRDKDLLMFEELLRCDREFPHPHVRKRYVTSFRSCMKHEGRGLLVDGFLTEHMDETEPDIVIKDWYAARFDCGCQYKLTVQLLSAGSIDVDEFDPEKVVIKQWSDAEWQEMMHTFHNYPSHVRYISFQPRGQETQFWAGWHGVRVTYSSITFGPEGASSGGGGTAPCLAGWGYFEPRPF